MLPALHVSAPVTAAPDETAEFIKWVSALVSTQVQSQHSFAPFLKGNIRLSSGVLSSPLSLPKGSRTDGSRALYPPEVKGLVNSSLNLNLIIVRIPFNRGCSVIFLRLGLFFI